MRSCHRSPSSSAGVPWKNAFGIVLFLFSELTAESLTTTTATTAMRARKAQQWPIDFLRRRLAIVFCYSERFCSILNLDCMQRRHRPWMTDDRWHDMPLMPLLLLLHPNLNLKSMWTSNRKIENTFRWLLFGEFIFKTFARHRYLYRLLPERMNACTRKCQWRHVDVMWREGRWARYVRTYVQQ